MDEKALRDSSGLFSPAHPFVSNRSRLRTTGIPGDCQPQLWSQFEVWGLTNQTTSRSCLPSFLIWGSRMLVNPPPILGKQTAGDCSYSAHQPVETELPRQRLGWDSKARGRAEEAVVRCWLKCVQYQSHLEHQEIACFAENYLPHKEVPPSPSPVCTYPLRNNSCAIPNHSWGSSHSLMSMCPGSKRWIFISLLGHSWTCLEFYNG